MDPIRRISDPIVESSMIIFIITRNKVGIEYKIHPEFRLALAVGDYDTYASGGTFVKTQRTMMNSGSGHNYFSPIKSLR
jgi:hypothetical protein